MKVWLLWYDNGVDTRRLLSVHQSQEGAVAAGKAWVAEHDYGWGYMFPQEEEVQP